MLLVLPVAKDMDIAVAKWLSYTSIESLELFPSFIVGTEVAIEILRIVKDFFRIVFRIVA